MTSRGAIESQGSTIRSTIAGGSPLGSTGDVSDSTLTLDDGEVPHGAGMSLTGARYLAENMPDDPGRDARYATVYRRGRTYVVTASGP